MALRYGRSVGGNWNGAAAWSTTTGGAADVPGGLVAGDEVVLDGNSGAGVFVINAAISLLGIDCGGAAAGSSGTAFAGTLTNTAGQTITGDDTTVTAGNLPFRLVAGMTYNGAGALTFSAAAANQVSINSANKITANLTVGSSGTSLATYKLLDHWNGTNALGNQLTLTSGHFHANNKNVTTSIYSSSNANTRTTTQGSGTWKLNVTRNANAWDYTTATNLTHNKDTATTHIQGAHAGLVGFQTGGKNFYNVIFENTGTGPGYVSVSLISTTFDFLDIRPNTSMRFGGTSAHVLTINNPFTWAGSGAANSVEILANVPDITRPIISVASGTCTIDFGQITGMAFQGGATFNATNSIGCNNTGINFAAFSGAAHSYGMSGGMP